MEASSAYFVSMRTFGSWPSRWVIVQPERRVRMRINLIIIEATMGNVVAEAIITMLVFPEPQRVYERDSPNGVTDIQPGTKHLLRVAS